MKKRISIILGLLCAIIAPIYAESPGEVAAMAMEGYRLFVRDSLPDDRTKGYAMMLEAAWEGDAKAANNVGWLLEQGEFAEKDLSGALRWYERAADQGLPAAALNYVSMIFHHPEVIAGKAIAVEKVANAAMAAGKALATGRGLHYDYRQGEDLIIRAGLLGNQEAATTIAQQLEMYPDSFSYLPLKEIAEECDAILPAENKYLARYAAEELMDLMLTPGFWIHPSQDKPEAGNEGADKRKNLD